MSENLVTGVEWFKPKAGAGYLARGSVKIADALSISIFIRKNSSGDVFVSWPGRMADGKWMSDVFVFKEARDNVDGKILQLYEAEFGKGNGGSEKKNGGNNKRQTPDVNDF